MTKTGKVDRARRNALKATGLIVGSLVATGVSHKWASAQDHRGSAPVSPPRPCFDRDRDWGPFRGPGRGPDCGGNCFAQGTQIRTREGYRPIETLAAGDAVAVRFGGFAPIRAIVRHTLNRAAGQWSGDSSNLPVVIRRGALAENVPTADLCVTALHAVYIDGFLMKAGDLVNETSIHFKPADGEDELDFFNIELERHDVVEAQGAFCESLYRAGTERCAPDLAFDGGRSRLRSHLRSVASLVIDRRRPIDIIRDDLEERALEFAKAA